jgi:23S rRNA pseudouridine2605 synthase
MERVQKIIANAGITSRRKAEVMIEEGRVIVNGKKCQVGQSADLEKDTIVVNGKQLEKNQKFYLIFNKPKGVVCAVKDDFEEKLVVDFLPPQYQNKHIYPVGRLDKDAEGLLLLTNDGDFANKVMHPRYELSKTYRAWLSEPILKKQVNELTRGIKLDDGPVDDIELKQINPKCVDITVHVGRHKVVKRIFQHVGIRVLRLKRLYIGQISLGDVPTGKMKPLPRKFVDYAKKLKVNKKE